MASIDVAQFREIPYLSGADMGGRFLCTLTFYDGAWHFWVDAGGRLIKAQIVEPIEGLYFSATQVGPSDICFHFLDLIAQRANFSNIGKAFMGLQDDIHNLATSLAKIRWLHQTKNVIGGGVSRMVRTEIEFAFGVCRSIFDLFHEIIWKLWDNVTLVQGQKTKRPLKASYSDTLLFKGQPSGAEKLVERFGMPNELAYCYVRSADFFMALRRFRDNVVHRGSPVQIIFEGDHDFLVKTSLVPFSTLGIWKPEERLENDLVPLLPALAYVMSETLGVCEDFTLTIEKIIQLLPPTVPGMRLFLRGYFNEPLISTLEDIRDRRSSAG